MRSLRLVFSLALSDCLYCHFSGTKGHFISMASCRREASSAHSEATGKKVEFQKRVLLIELFCPSYGRNMLEESCPSWIY